MKLTIDIPKEYENDFIGDKFKDFFSRVIADINCDGLCGFYEKEIAEMFLEAFDKAIVGEINPTANVIPVANISFDKDDMREIIKEELKKFKNEPVKLYKKQIRPIAKGGAWQGFSPELTPLSDWIDIKDSEEQIENQLKEKWTDEAMFKITHDKMRWLEFEYRFVEIES